MPTRDLIRQVLVEVFFFVVYARENRGQVHVDESRNPTSIPVNALHV